MANAGPGPVTVFAAETINGTGVEGPRGAASNPLHMHNKQMNPRRTNKKCASPTHGLSCTPQHQRRIATTSASGVPPLTAGIPIHTYVYHLRSTGR